MFTYITGNLKSMININLSTEQLTETAALTELINSNKRRIAIYTIALAQHDLDKMTKRVYRCMIDESEQNIKELSHAAGLEIDTVWKESNAILEEPNILSEEGNLTKMYERFLTSVGLGGTIKNIINNQFKELKVSLDIIRMHDNKHEHAQVLVA